MGRAEDDALRRAIVDDDLERAEELLRAGADPDVVVGVIRAKSPYLNPCFAPNQFRGLHLAANDDDPELAALLLLHGANAHSPIYAGALSAASRCGRAAVVDHLIEVGAQLYGPKKKADPLFDALRGGHTATADRLWSAGCRTRDMVERTILLGLPFESVRWAFERVPEPGVGRALYAAARSRRIDVARFALERGADPSHRHSDRSPLMVAASRRQVELMELLIAHGADVHAVDGEGRTAMHYALFAGELDDPDDGPFDYTDDALERPAVKLLLRHGLLVPPRAT